MKLDCRLLPALFCALSFWGCSVEDAGGSGSGTENALRGTLVDDRGQAISGAQVWLLPSGRGPVTAGGGDLPFGSPTARTDAAGHYAFKALAAGQYNLQGDYHAGTLSVFHPGVDHAAQGSEDAGADTLRAPGAIRGKVVTDDGGDPIGALCGITGTSFIALSDSAGAFLLSGVPQGRYDVTYRLPGYVPGKDTGVNVQAGRSTLLPMRILKFDASAASIAPKGLQAVYDRAAEKVTLHWHPWPGPVAFTYQITSRSGAGGIRTGDYGDGFRLFDVGGTTRDTTWTDTLVRHAGFDLAAFRETHPDSTPPPYAFEISYTVIPMGSDADQPFFLTHSGSTLTVATDKRLWSRRHAYTLFAIGHNAGDTVTRGDTLRIVAVYHDSLDPIDSLRWHRKSPYTNDPSNLIAVRTPASRDFSDTLVRVVDETMVENGFISIAVEATGPFLRFYDEQLLTLTTPLYYRP